MTRLSCRMAVTPMLIIDRSRVPSKSRIRNALTRVVRCRSTARPHYRNARSRCQAIANYCEILCKKARHVRRRCVSRGFLCANSMSFNPHFFSHRRGNSVALFLTLSAPFLTLRLHHFSHLAAPFLTIRLHYFSHYFLVSSLYRARENIVFKYISIYQSNCTR